MQTFKLKRYLPLTVFSLLFITTLVIAQDAIYMKDTTIIRAYVKEITATEIKYTIRENFKMIPKSVKKQDAIQIGYSGWEEESFLPDGSSSSKSILTFPQKNIWKKQQRLKEQQLAQKNIKRDTLNYFKHKNMVSINPLLLVIKEVDVIYQRDLSKDYELMIPIGFGIGEVEDTGELGIIGDNVRNTHKVIHVGLGINATVYTNERNRIYVGGLYKYRRYDALQRIEYEVIKNNGSYNYESTEYWYHNVNVNSHCFTGTLGFMHQFNERINFQTFASFGINKNYLEKQLPFKNDYDFHKRTLNVYLGLCLGYRF